MSDIKCCAWHFWLTFSSGFGKLMKICTVADGLYGRVMQAGNETDTK